MEALVGLVKLPFKHRVFKKNPWLSVNQELLAYIILDMKPKYIHETHEIQEIEEDKYTYYPKRVAVPTYPSFG